jgi:hypothetical protein
MQQVGASLGLAVLVTVFGTASRAALPDVTRGSSRVDAAAQVFVAGAHGAFVVAAAFLAVTLLIVATMRPRRRVVAA